MKLFAILFFAILLLPLGAQTIRPITVDDALRIALENAEELKNLRLDEQIQFYKNKELSGLTLPQISGSGQASYYLFTPQVQFPTSDIGIYQVLEREGVVDKNGNPIDKGNATSGTQAVSFFAPLNFQFGLSANQLLFQPDIFIANQARETILEFARENTSVAEIKVKEAVRKAYYAVLIGEKQRGVMIETMKRLQKLNADMTKMYENGFVEKLDIDKLQVTINNAQTGLNQIENALKITHTLLKSTIGISMVDSLKLVDKLDVVQLKSDLLAGDSDFNYESRKEISLLNTARFLQELDIKRHRLSYYPTVAAFLNYQRSGQRNAEFNPEDPWFWFSTGIVGLSINAPIFDGFQKKYRIEQSKLNLKKVDHNLSQVKRLIDMERIVARTSLNNAILNLEVQERNMKLAEEVFNTTKKKYEAGVGSSFEVLQVDTELQRAQGSYFQALYDGYIAETAYLKSIGKL